MKDEDRKSILRTLSDEQYKDLGNGHGAEGTSTVKDGRALPSSSAHNNGGYMGIPQPTKNEGQKWTQGKRRAREEKEDEGKSGISQDNEMFILGLLKEQRQEEKDRCGGQQISEEALGCASDEKAMQKFER